MRPASLIVPAGPALQRFDEDAIMELQLNDISRADAIRALKATGGDAEAAALWLLQEQAQQAAGQDEQAVAELEANGLSPDDAVAALAHCGGDVEQVGGEQAAVTFTAG